MDAVEDIKNRLSIEDVVSDYVQLKRSGRNWKGLSPFTTERTPSFMVSSEKQIWHDFSSGKGGNMFSFVMEMEGLDFKGALELLARKAGIDLSAYHTGPRRGGPNKERLYELLELSTKFYQVQFSKNDAALQYIFQKRRFTKETALEWRLGYAPNTGSALIDFLRSKGFADNEMKLAGVTAQRYSGVGDMFRGRLMVPLADPQGRVIGFTARLLQDDPRAPKYINTPQTVLYDKSRHVFGLHLAKEAIRHSSFVVLVEGNLDVIASHQAGVKQAVAVAGTALTEYQLKALRRFTDDVRVSFDADRAGVAATERAIPLASKVGVSLSIIDIPNGKDPDELIRRDPMQWQQAIAAHKYALDWLMDRYKSLLDIETAVGKREFTDILLPVVRRLNDSVEQDHYLGVIADTIGISREALDTKLSKVAVEPATVKQVPKHDQPPVDKQQVEFNKAQDHILTLLLMRPHLRTYLSVLEPGMFAKAESRQLLEFLKANQDLTGTPAGVQLIAAINENPPTVVQNVADYVKILVLEYEELYQDLDSTELAYEAARLTARLVETFVKQQKQILAAQLAGADEAHTMMLLEEVKKLDALLKRVKGGS